MSMYHPHLAGCLSVRWSLGMKCFLVFYRKDRFAFLEFPSMLLNSYIVGLFSFYISNFGAGLNLKLKNGAGIKEVGRL